MGIQNRDYYRSNSSSGGLSSLAGTSMCQKILIVTVVAYLAQVFITSSQPDWQTLVDMADPEESPVLYKLVKENRVEDLKRMAAQMGLYDHTSVLESWCALEPTKVAQGQVWRLLTYAFLHGRHGNNAIMHIVFNMLVLWMFGPPLEELWGRREFLAFYLTAAIFSGLTHVLFAFAMRDPTGAVGASGALMGVMMVFAIHYPRAPVNIFLLFTVEARWMIALYLVWDLLPVINALTQRGHRSDGIAHAAHLGGLLFGYLYQQFGWKLTGHLGQRGGVSLGRRFVRWFNRPKLRVYQTPAEGPPPVQRPGPASRPTPRDLERQVDVILAKIKEHGEASLTDDERALLREASQAYKRRHS